MTLTIISTKQLNNGVAIPYFGLGLWMVEEGRQAENVVRQALDVGYRHFDTAMFYANEDSLGRAVRAGGIPRSDIFITTKVWNTDHGYDETIRAFESSFEKLGLDYIDLYLIHWPVEKIRLETWRAMETLLDQGRVKAIGVSNYMVRHLEELLAECHVPPAVNQIELHPYNYLYRKNVIDFCRARDIQIEAYTPLVRGCRFDDPKLTRISGAYDKSPAQILIRWALQHRFNVIPKSARPDRIRENADVFDFKISREDMETIDSFNEDLIVCWDPTDAP